MKRTISLLMSAVMLLGMMIPVSAADSDKVKASLAGVKTRIDVPQELSVFRSSSNEYDNKIAYNFSWTDEEENKRIYVTADEEGRIGSYYYSEDTDFDDYPTLTDVTRDDAAKMAEAFLQKAAPELFANERDKLVQTGAYGSASNGRARYSFNYEREKNDTAVYGNQAYISITAYGDKAYVSDMTINWSYDAQFAAHTVALENPDAAYFDAFEIELSYARRYSGAVKTLSDGTKISDNVVMQYAFKDTAGYISAENGEVLEVESDEDGSVSGGSGGGMKQTSAVNEAAADMVSFTDEELAELERVEGLMTEAQAEQIIRSIKELKLSDNMKLKSISYRRQTPWYLKENNDVNKEKFLVNIRLSEEIDGKTKRNMSAVIDAESGELYNISNYSWYDDESTKDSTGNPETEIAQFLNQAAPEKLSQFEEIEKDESGKTPLSGRMRRIVNGIPYSGNYITYAYDEDYSRISSYNLTWDDYTDYFADPAKAIGKENAQEKMLEYVPLRLIYIPNGGEYKLCYTLSQSAYYTVLDALTGEQLNVNVEKEQQEIKYSDIAGHWSQQAVLRLAESGLTEAADTFRPDDKMTQKELLTMFASALMGGSYWSYDEESFYEMLERRGYFRLEEKNAGANVKREDAFVYMIRMMGYERVAKLDGIYSCGYTDIAELSADKVGYAAILTGFGVVSGDASALRAKDDITRAEAAMMIYKYLTYKG